MKKKLFLYLGLIVLMILASACADLMGSTKKSTVTDNVFKISIQTDKDTCTTSDVITCYSTLEYVGGADSITIYSGDPLVYFSIKGGVFDGDYTVSPVLKTTTLNRGEPLRFEFSKGGGYTEKDKNADFWKSWFADPELKLPEGEYTISATVAGAFDQDDVQGSAYSLTASKDITVTE